MRTFQDKEKRYIKDQLMEKGKELFSMYGIKKTSVEDLTKSVGIGKGSFYKFFSSKEELYFQIMNNEIKNLAQKNINTLDMEKPLKETLKEFLLQAVEGVRSNPILKRMLVPEEFELVKRRITGISVDNVDFLSPLVMFLSKLKKDGLIIQINPLILANVIKGLFLLSTHKREIGEEHFEDVMQFYASMIAEKLTDVARQSGKNNE